MVINLFGNASKDHSPENGHVWITIEKMKGFIHRCKANTGLQIPEDELLKLFDQFFRVEKSRSTVYGESGIGLTIAEKIVALHHGRILATSISAGLSRFTIDF